MPRVAVGGCRETVIGQQRHDVRGGAVDRDRDEEERCPQHPETRRARRLAHRVTERQGVWRGSASFAFAGPRFADPQSHCRERDGKRQQP